MGIVYLNGEFIPAENAKISPMDRGFLFGDGVYEVIPSYQGKLVGFGPHIARLQNSLREIALSLPMAERDWRDIATTLLSQNKYENAGIYIHVSRGEDVKRFHGFPKNTKPTVFAYAFEIPPQQPIDQCSGKGLAITTAEDLRWKRCNIKSTSLLGHVLHFQSSQDEGANEVVLYNGKNEVTEAAACNVFIVKNDVISTPELNNQLLPGITRQILLDMLNKEGIFEIQERVVLLDELLDADEVWLTSSSKGVAPVTSIDGNPVGKGVPGDLAKVVQRLYLAHQFDY
ncbi:D-amino acid aminotransferase [Aestuariibacter sp. AA17]|uniref:branched-chain-amino-acid transaminase n=1 Tax=Fluctibacter corallii TaxID=2984329 RepID=A0ABT3A5G6_9ALTE|nr:D-amino acid aminotransferase [Aestuariibacter sp. AA17]MCV2883931.1 D-amino acid aminotransferase [Aestuariibacter sp. AA17]